MITNTRQGRSWARACSRGTRALVIAALAGGCAARAPHPMQTSIGALDAARPGDVMSADDRSRLAALAAARAGAGDDDGYRIGPDDLLDVRVPDLLQAQAPPAAARLADGAVATTAGTPVFQQGMRVSAQGDVTIPMLGLVHVEGLTANAVETEVARRLVTAGLLRAPQVTVQVVEYRARVVAVVGSVERPGLYPVTRPHATVADLVWAAGGPTKDAGRVVEFVPAGTGPARADTHPVPPPAASAPGAGTPATLMRIAATDGAARGAEPPIRLDLAVLLQATGRAASDVNPPVRAGDVISLSPAGSVTVDGWVDKPGAYPVTRGLTLGGAVAAAGGYLFPADRSQVTVTRVVAPGEQRSFTVDLAAVAEGRAPDVPLTDGDVVRLPAAAGRLVPWGFWNIAKTMIHVGGSVLLF